MAIIKKSKSGYTVNHGRTEKVLSKHKTKESAEKEVKRLHAKYYPSHAFHQKHKIKT